jgi:hypothetical protein
LQFNTNQENKSIASLSVLERFQNRFWLKSSKVLKIKIILLIGTWKVLIFN